MRSHWAWGRAADEPTIADQDGLAAMLHRRLGWDDLAPSTAVAVRDLALPRPRVAVPGSLAQMASTDVRDRAQHAYGRSYRDVARAHAGRFDHPPEAVLRLSLIHISEPTRLLSTSYAVFCLKKKKQNPSRLTTSTSP